MAFVHQTKDEHKNVSAKEGESRRQLQLVDGEPDVKAAKRNKVCGYKKTDNRGNRTGPHKTRACLLLMTEL